MFLIASGAAFLVFAANVAMGAFANAAFMGDVAEMLVLFLATILFVIAILRREAARRNDRRG